jgi:competence protein ComEC
MVSLLLLARLLRRPPSTLNALALATVALPLVRPEWILDPSFRLSVAATAEILILAPVIVERWGFHESAVGKGLAISVAAHLATLPIALPLFLQFSAGGPVWNLFAVPWTAFALVCCMAWSVLVAVMPDLGMWLAPFLDLLALLSVCRPSCRLEYWERSPLMRTRPKR